MTARRPLVLVDGQFRQLPAGDTLEAAQGFFRTVAIAATAAGQTMYTVPGGYTPGAIFVSLNGSALAPADFTAADGASVVLESGAGIVVGSVLLVYVLSAFEVADALPLGGTAADASRFGGQLPAYYATQEDLAGVTPGPEFYQRSNILGTVSQSGGVPTGAIIERGSNANGEYVRFADGTQICTHQISPATNNNAGTPWTFPAVFSGIPRCTGTPAAVASSGLGGSRVVETRDAGTDLVYVKMLAHTPTSILDVVGGPIDVVAHGRWY